MTNISLSQWRTSEWLLGIALCSLALFPFLMDIEAHDSQRLITIGIAGSLMVWRIWGINWSLTTYRIFILLMTLGWISVLLSPAPFWSALEVSLFMTVFILPFVLFPQVDAIFLRRFTTVIVLIQGGYIVKYLWNYGEVLANGYPLHALSIIDGFSNIRFYGQFLVWTIPFCTAMLAISTHRWLRLSFGLILAFSWAMADLSGSRSFFLAMLGSSLMVLWLTPALWKRYTIWLLATAVVGTFLYAILVLWLPVAFASSEPQTLASYSIYRDFSDANGRWDIWLHTLKHALASPWFGLGPMLTAEVDFFKAEAHPHNYLLQWAAEWGLPFTLTLITFLSYQCWRWRVSIQVNPSERALLAAPVAASLGAAIVAGLFDGLAVMPVSLAYLVVMLGIAIRLQQTWHPNVPRTPLGKPLASLILLPTLGLTGFVFSQIPYLWENAFTQTTPHVRFWTDGTLPLQRPFAKRYDMGGATHTHKQASVRLVTALQPYLAPASCQLFMSHLPTDEAVRVLNLTPDLSLHCPQEHYYLFLDLSQRSITVHTLDLTTHKWQKQYFSSQAELRLAALPISIAIENLFTEK